MDANQKSEPGIVRSTKHYDSWLLALEPAFEHDLKQKLKVVAGVPGDFLRATFYRWSERFPDVCLEVISAPSVGAVGDVHVGNFGTWPCGEGRLRWGLNDFDEAGWMPFTNDLVRLATSALLARSDLDPEVVGRTILSGYSQRLRGGEFGALDIAGDAHLRASAAAARPSAEAFFGKLAGKDELDADDARRLTRLCERLGEAVPGGEFHHRRAGRGSLGRVRVLVLGGEPPVAVEAKRVLRSAWSWARRDGHADPTAGDDRNGDLSALLLDPRRGQIRKPASRRSVGINGYCGPCRRTGWASISVTPTVSARIWRPGSWSVWGLKLRTSTYSHTTQCRSFPTSPTTSLAGYGEQPLP